MRDGGVTAIVVAARGGARLARALASVAWADERIVWDPAERLHSATVPAGVRHVAGDRVLALLGTEPWLVVLEEEEALDTDAAMAIGAATGAAAGHAAYRIERTMEALGETLRVGGVPVRLARRSGVRLQLGRGLGVTLAVAGSVGRLEGKLVARRAARVGDALDDLDADGAVLAVLLYAAGIRSRVGHMVLAPIAAGARLLVARGAPGLGWGRWILSVLGGYRALVAYAKLWEIERRRVAVPW